MADASLAEMIAQAVPLDTEAEGVQSTDRSLNAGAYQRGESLVAINRPLAEDLPATLSTSQVERLMGGIDFRHVEEQVGSGGQLASEIWRVFLLGMAGALIAEAWLCLPEKR